MKINCSAAGSIAFLLTFIIGSICFLILAGCDGDDPPRVDQKKEFLTKLSGTWDVTSVELDGVNVTELFDGLRIIIAEDGTFQCTTPLQKIWRTSGSFQLVENAQTASTGIFDLMRDDEALLRVVVLSGTALTLEYNYVNTGGRMTSVSGSYTFEFTAQPD